MNKLTATLPPAPRKISDASGKPLIGTYQGYPDVIDSSDLKGDFKPRPLDGLVRNKAFAYTALSGVSDEGKHVKVVMAIADLHYASNCFVTVYDVDAKKVLADRSFMAGKSRITPEPAEGLQASFTGWAHHARLSLSRPKGSEVYSQHIDIAASKDQPSIAFDGTFGGPAPATVISPVIRGKETYPTAVETTVKSQALTGSGTLNVGDQVFHLSEMMGAVDSSRGTMNRVTEWRWGSATGKLDDGRTFGLNMGAGFNDSDPRANDNLMWVVGKDGNSQILPLPHLHFDFDSKKPLEPWHVSSEDSSKFAVDLDFEPIGMHTNMTNLGIIKSNFVQPSGLWSGTVTDKATGESYTFHGADGEGENQHVKW